MLLRLFYQDGGGQELLEPVLHVEPRSDLSWELRETPLGVAFGVPELKCDRVVEVHLEGEGTSLGRQESYP